MAEFGRNLSLVKTVHKDEIGLRTLDTGMEKLMSIRGHCDTRVN